MGVQEYHRASSSISPSNGDSQRPRLLEPRIFDPRSILLRAFYGTQDQGKGIIASDAQSHEHRRHTTKDPAREMTLPPCIRHSLVTPNRNQSPLNSTSAVTMRHDPLPLESLQARKPSTWAVEIFDDGFQDRVKQTPPPSCTNLLSL